MNTMRLSSLALLTAVAVAVPTGAIAAETDTADGRGVVVSSTPVLGLDAQQVKDFLQPLGVYVPEARHGVDAYRVFYRTIDVNGSPTTASTLVVLPRTDDRRLRPAIWMHGCRRPRRTCCNPGTPRCFATQPVHLPGRRASTAGFALSRMQWRGRKVVFVAVIATLIVPFETIAIPTVFWVSKLPWWGVDSLGVFYDPGWLNTYRVQIIPFIANAFSIFLFAQYFSTIPKELDEAAKVDGCGWFTIFHKIIAPLAGPAYATVAILSFLPAWNAYLWPLMVVQEEDLRPVMVGLQYFFQGNTAEGVAWGQIMAYSSMITLPVLLVFLVFQRAFVSSIASSGMKN